MRSTQFFLRSCCIFSQTAGTYLSTINSLNLLLGLPTKYKNLAALLLSTTLIIDTGLSKGLPKHAIGFLAILSSTILAAINNTNIVFNFLIQSSQVALIFGQLPLTITSGSIYKEIIVGAIPMIMATIFPNQLFFGAGSLLIASTFYRQSFFKLSENMGDNFLTSAYIPFETTKKLLILSKDLCTNKSKELRDFCKNLYIKKKFRNENIQTEISH